MTVGSVEEANALNLYAIATNSPAKGAAATAASTPVNIASDQVVPVKEADGANATLGSKSDTAGANAAVANQTAQSRLAGIWAVLGSLTDAAATVWDNTSNSISSLLRGIGGMVKSTVTAPGGNPTAVVNVQGSASGTPLPVSATGLSRIPALGQATMANSTPVTMASDQAPQTVVGRFLRVPCTQFTRPATTGTVVQGSVCGPVTTPAVMTFPNCARANGGSGLLKAALLNFKWPSGTPINTGFAQRLKIFNVAPTPISDGSLWTVLQANFGSWQGSFDFNSMNAEGATYTGSDSIHGMGAPVLGAADADIAFVCAAGDRHLYGVLINEGTNTQVASMVVDAALIVDQN